MPTQSSSSMSAKIFRLEIFWLPALVLLLIMLGVFQIPYAFLAAVILGIAKITIDSFENIRAGRWSLDYIAFLAMVVAVIAHEYGAGSVIALMFTGGEALEAFASHRAFSALSKLGDTIPKNCIVQRGEKMEEVPIQRVKDGERIIIKRGEIIPLDGIIKSPDVAIFNMANLTGEPEPQSLHAGTFVKSGSINLGDTIGLQVVGDFSSSTYHKIANLVEEAKKHPARIVRLSEKANFTFTFIAFLSASLAYILSGELARALAVLVIATPCPLIIAAPAAFVSGMSRLARSGIILRRPAALEAIVGAKKIFFDKTGTLTLGEPTFKSVEMKDDSSLSENDALSIASSIEIHSLHPLARTIIGEARKRNISYPIASDVKEQIGEGISGSIAGTRYNIRRSQGKSGGITLSLRRTGLELAKLHFEDTLKEGTEGFLDSLRRNGVEIAVITGDSMENAKRVFQGINIDIHADITPEGKYAMIDEAHKQHQIVAMVGDGLNDAPALARSDVGIVFSGSENGASIEAAEVVMLDHRIEKLGELFVASHRTLSIARQSIYGGIILSSVGMVFAAFGFIPPITGAFIQEAIDVIVILNALRALTA